MSVVKIFRLVGIGLLAIAVILVAVLAWNLRPGRYDGWVQTTGTVVGHQERVSYDEDDRGRRHARYTYAPVIEFTDETGQVRTVTSDISSSSPPDLGSTEDVRYPAGRPGEAETGNTVGFMALFLGIWIFVLGVIGTVFTVISFKARLDGPSHAPLSSAGGPPPNPAQPGEWPTQPPAEGPPGNPDWR